MREENKKRKKTLPKGSLFGWVIITLVVLFDISMFRTIDSTSHSASDTLYQFFPYFIASLALVYLVFKKIKT